MMKKYKCEHIITEKCFYVWAYTLDEVEELLSILFDDSYNYDIISSVNIPFDF